MKFKIIDGFIQRFSSIGHYKTKGITVSLKLPKSWKAMEA